jgi:hypothetical protein
LNLDLVETETSTGCGGTITTNHFPRRLPKVRSVSNNPGFQGPTTKSTCNAEAIVRIINQSRNKSLIVEQSRPYYSTIMASSSPSSPSSNDQSKDSNVDDAELAKVRVFQHSPTHQLVSILGLLANDFGCASIIHALHSSSPNPISMNLDTDKPPQAWAELSK